MLNRYFYIAILTLIGTVNPSFIFGNGAISLSGYLIPVTSSLKPDASISGIYSYFGYEAFSVELEVDKLTNTESAPDQQNAVFIFSDHSHPNTHLRLGINQIQPEDGLPSSVYILGASFDQYNYYGVLDAKVGADLFFGSHASEFRTITATQINPWISHSFGSSIIPGWITVTTKARLQYLSEDLGHGRLLSGAEIGLSDYMYPFTAAGKLWTGSSQYGVYEDGFAVYNNSDLMTTGISASLKYNIDPKLALSMSYTYYSIYLENDPTRGDLQKVMGMISYSL